MNYNLKQFSSVHRNAVRATLVVAQFAILVTCLLSADGRADELIGYDQVKDILRKRCVTCHNPDEMRGDLDLKDFGGIQAGSASGAVVVANDPSASLLYTTVAHLEDPKMPPNSPRLPAREQDLLRRWIEGGLAEKSGPSSTPTSIRPPVNTVKTTSGGLVEVRHLPQGTPIRAIDAHPSRDLIAVSGLRQAVLVEGSTAKILGAFDTPLGSVTSLRFSRDGKLLLIGVSQPAVLGTVFAFDIDSGEIRWQIGDETDSILAMDLSVDGKTLAVGGPTRMVRLYDVASGKVIHSLKKHTDWILTLQFSPDGLLLASGDRFGAIFVWDPKNGSVFQNLKDHTGAVQSILWDDDCETLISGGHDGNLRTWNLHHGELTSRWDAQVGAILSVAKGSDSIVAAGRNKKLSHWRSPEKIAGTINLADQGEALAVGADKSWLAVSDALGQISIVNLHENRVIRQMSLPIDADTITQLLQQVEAQHAKYAAQNNNQRRLPQSTVSNIPEKETTITSVTKPPATTSLPTPTHPVAVTNPAVGIEPALQSQIESSRQHLAQLTSALQASNRSLRDLAKLNENLVSMVGQASSLQAQYAQQIADQSKLLNEMEMRLKQLEETVESLQQQ